MTAAKALLLGLIQGIAEFLPISSSGHLVLFKDMLGLSEVPLLFDVILHLATLLAVVIVLRKRIGAIFAALWHFLFGKKTKNAKSLTKTQKKKEEARSKNLAYVLPILIATVVTAAAGFLIQKFVPQEGPKVVAVEMLVTAVILGLTALAKPGTRGPDSIGKGRAALIGLAQGIGVFSGVSRSGATISAGLFAGLDRETAGEFSFLLSIPAILGAFILTIKDAGTMMAALSYGHLALAFLTAFFSGMASLKILLKIIKGGKIYWFSLYLLAVGVLGLILA